MDFFRIAERTDKEKAVEIYPDFLVKRSKDMMIRGKSFYAIYDPKTELWSMDEYDVQRMVDEELWDYRNERAEKQQHTYRLKLMKDFSSGSWKEFRRYLTHLSDNSHQLDENLTFANTEIKKTDYVSKRLPYSLEEGSIQAWDEIVGTLYDKDEREKIEWAIGAIVAGDAKRIQKFLVFYGPGGKGKSTIMQIIEWLFEGYTAMFDAKALTGNNNSFATEVFRSNPLVAIQHDGDLSRIEDNTKLNSIVSHENMTMNEKFKPSYTARVNAFLFMGTNKPVKITDAKSGIIRRLIDVQPTGELIAPKRYQALMSQITFELGAIAHHCREVYLSMGKDYFSGYRPLEMMLQTDVFMNFVEDNFETFKRQDGVSLNQAYELYKQYCEQALVDFKLPKYKFRTELTNYFEKFEERAIVQGERVRSWYSGFRKELFTSITTEETVFPLVLDQTESYFDEHFGDCRAQYANESNTPLKYWTAGKEVTRTDKKTGKQYKHKVTEEEIADTYLKDLDTSKTHFVKVPENHIVIDFDLKGDDGEKSAEKNLEAASKWPPTYAEYSQGGAGIHLHYNWLGDVSELSRIFSEGIEIKVFTGDTSLRRRLSKANNVPVASLSTGLPLKEKKVINAEKIKSEKALRDLIERNLRKEIHGATKPSIDFIKKILDDAYESDLPYDVSDMYNRVVGFALRSTNQSEAALNLVNQMKFKSSDTAVDLPEALPQDETRLVFFDVEVFKNLFVICWKYEGDSNVVRMINPTAQAVEELMRLKLIGFNNRQYDNHILYAAMLGFTGEKLYEVSKRIIENAPGAKFGEAYNISYTDIFDYSSVKQSLKKFQVELGLVHKELGLDWDEPVPEELWMTVAEYCENDVISTEQVHNARSQDFVARQILSEITGLSPNASTQQHTARLCFGAEKNPQKQFVYTDLSTKFPGYKFEWKEEETPQGTKKVTKTSTYRGMVTGEGGLVFAVPGMYNDVALLDVRSMHPTSIGILNHFGPYTQRFLDLLDARLAIKDGDFEKAGKMFGGALKKYLVDDEQAEALAYALKIVVNIVYGLTSASFTNPFRDPRNKDNIVAKIGALFMIDLLHAVQELGFTVVHIKTDSIKIANATPEIINFVMQFGASFGYTFEHEATYSKMTLVNDAVYIAKYGWAAKEKLIGKWTATGAQFAHPYVHKTLFTHEPIELKDLAETKQVTTAMYLDMSEGDVPLIFDNKAMRFIGKVGQFVPIKPGKGGGLLMREKDGKFSSVTGAKGYRWLEYDVVNQMDRRDDVDMSYFTKLADAAADQIAKYGDYEAFVA